MRRNEEVKVLVVDDDYLVAKGIVRSLKQVGYAIAGQAADGAAAIKSTQELQPDVILMDINMPGVDGIEASSKIQETCPTPIVIVTAYETSDILDQASQAGAGAYLTKPVDSASLERAIAIAMARHGDIMRWRTMCDKLSEKNEALEKALAEIKTLQGIIPICCKCKKIRDDGGFWSQVEEYFSNHTDVAFSHSYCPTCMDEVLKQVEK